MRAFWFAPLLVGCGDNAGLAMNDGPMDCPVGGGSAVPVAITAFGPLLGSSLNIDIPPTEAGDLVVLALSQGSPSSPRDAVPQAGASPPGCSGFTSVWSLGRVGAGLSSLTISTNVDAPLFAVVAEFSGLSADAGTALAPFAASPFNSSEIAVAPPVQACPGDLVFSSVTTCGSITRIDDQSPFIPVVTAPTFAAAYYVASATGEYGAVWLYDGLGGAGNTVLFR